MSSSLIERDIMVLLADGKVHSATEIGSYAGLGRERAIAWCDRLCREGKLERGVKEVMGICRVTAYRRLV